VGMRFVEVGTQIGRHIFRYVAGLLANPFSKLVSVVLVDRLVVAVSISGLCSV
jgi:hypothetical protein